MGVFESVILCKDIQSVSRMKGTSSVSVGSRQCRVFGHVDNLDLAVDCLFGPKRKEWAGHLAACRLKKSDFRSLLSFVCLFIYLL